MVFINGKYFYFDNGTLKHFTQFKDYFDKIKKDEYGIFDLEDNLTFKDVNGQKITINLEKKDVVCRHLANIIFDKLEELSTTQPEIKSVANLVMAIHKYYTGYHDSSSGKQTTFMRANSFKQVGSAYLHK
jgi:hypothetical protein